jgi:hypothetical protein
MTTEKTVGEFGKLLGDLEALSATTLAKAASGDDDRVIAAAAAAGAADDGKEKTGKNPDGLANKDEEDDEKLAKSLQLFDKDGQPIEAIDGTAMVKALQDEVETIKAARADENMHLGKSLSLVCDMLSENSKLIKAQGAAIDSLNTQIEKLSNSGRGQRSAIVVPAAQLAKSEGAGDEKISDSDLLAKAAPQLGNGKISGADIAMGETYINRGIAFPEQLRSRLSA